MRRLDKSGDLADPTKDVSSPVAASTALPLIDASRAFKAYRRYGALLTDAERFRSRARECRILAGTATEPGWRDMLLNLARNLEAEADRMPHAEGDDAVAQPDSGAHSWA